MAYSPSVWSQIKNITARELQSALERDGWTLKRSGGSIHIYVKPQGFGNAPKRVSVHVRPQKTFGKDLLKEILDDIGWTENDLKRLKLIQ